MWCQTFLVVMIINCAKTFEGREDAISFSTLELLALAQCEARCYSIGENEEGAKKNIRNEEMGTKREKCLDGLNIPVLEPECSQKCNGSEECFKSCSCLKERHNSSVRRSVQEGPGPSAPQLHCREATMLSVRWECPSRPVFVLEVRSEEDRAWRPSNKTRRKMVILHNMKSNVLYQFRVRAILSDGQLGNASTSDWISTLNDTFDPGRVTDARAVNTTMGFDGVHLQTTLLWEPAWDRTCFYEVVCWSGAPSPKSNLITMPEKFEFVLDFLNFGTNYHIHIKGKNQNESRESIPASFNFSTPLCLQYYQNDLTKCVPPMPNNLLAEEKMVPGLNSMSQLYDVTVSWEAPALLPLFHEVKLMRLIPDSAILAHDNVTGNSTWVKFTALDVGSQYEVTVESVSEAGPSEIATVTRITTGNVVSIPTSYPNTTFSTESPTWGGGSLSLVILLPMLMVIIAAGVCMYAYRRHGKLIRYERRCQYIEKYSIVVSNLDRLVFSLLNYQTLDQKPSVRTECSGSVECDLDFDAKWEIPRENLVLGDVLGEGAFGIVRKGVLQEGDNWRDVAVKMLREEPTTDNLRQFKHEINMMQSVGRHPHIVSLIGCCTRAGRLRLVVEYCAQGDLHNFLRKNWNEIADFSGKRSSTCSNSSVRLSQQVKYAELLSLEDTGDGESISQFPGVVVNQMYDIMNAGDDNLQQPRKQLSATDLLSFARQTAMGMEYLSSNRVVHRDLAARNVLVCADRTVKISDFGLSRDIYEENVYRKKGSGRLPVKWMALESLLHQVYTTQSDVWSFGVLLWEIVTLGGNPYPGIPTNKLFNLLREGHRMECPTNCSKELYDIMLASWQAKPRDRPTFAELHKMLDDLLESSSPQKYLNLNLINYKNELKAFPRDEQHSSFRSSGGYLISNKNQEGSEG